MAMRRADRRTNSHDNQVNHPRSNRSEPISSQESKQLIITLRSQKGELQKKVNDTEQQAAQSHQQYLEEQQRYQSTLTLYQEEQQRYQSTFTLYQEEQKKYQSTLTLYQEEQHQHQSTLTLYQETQAKAETYFSRYDEEKARNSELSRQLTQVERTRDEYITLYNQAQDDLKFERRSKAGIKGWETRRKRENERLKKEIGEMTILLQKSIARRDNAIDNLEELASRMDRIQNLVDSVDDGSNDTPVGLVQKFKRIWQAIQDILTE